MPDVERALQYHKEDTALNKLKNYKANLKEMSPSGYCKTYKILKSLVAPRDSSYQQARLEYFHS